MKIKFSFLVALAAMVIAGCAAYYSIFGLSQLFAGASTAVIIMASGLEFSKIVSVSFLHRYWSKISTALKIYMLIGVFVLVCITSAGIYGFLSNAYQKTASKLEISENQFGLLNNKKDIFQKNIDDNNKIIAVKSKRLQQLTDIRTNQESRLDAAVNNLNRSRARSDISSSNQEIQKLNTEIDELNKKNTSLSDSVNFYANKSIELKSSEASSSEVGPLKYLAQLTGYPMEKVVNFFILLLIFVFDPMAVALVIATNRVLELEKKNNSDTAEPEIVDKKPKKKLSFNFIKNTKNKINSLKDKIVKNLEAKDDYIVERPKINERPERLERPEIIVKNETVLRPEPQQEIPGKKEEPEIKKENKPIEHKPQNFNTNRGFSVDIPDPDKKTIERIGSNKIVKDGNTNKIFFKKRS